MRILAVLLPPGLKGMEALKWKKLHGGGAAGQGAAKPKARAGGAGGAEPPPGLKGLELIKWKKAQREKAQ